MEPPTTSSQSATPLSTETSQPQSQPPPQSLPPSSSLPQPQSQPQPTLSSSSPVPVPTPIPNPNPNPPNSLTPFPQQPPGPPNNRGPPFNRPAWSQPTSQFSHFPSQFYSSPSPSTSSAAATPALPPQRGGIAIGVPAHHPSPPPSVSSQPAAAFSSSFGAQYGGALARNPVSVPDPSAVSSSTPSPARAPMHGMPSMGMIGSQIRPGGVPPSALHQQRPVPPTSGIRSQASANNLPSVPQNFQGHGMLRASSVTPPNTSTPSTSQSQQSPNQPWLSHGRPPLPSQSPKPQLNSQSLQQRSHIPQQSPQQLQAASQPYQLLPPAQQQQQQHFPASNQSQENYGQQLSSSRVSQPLANQQVVRVQGSANQRPPSPAMGHASIVHSGPTDNANAAEISESCSTILSKRNIQELVDQIDPSEKLDPEVEDVLVDIAEDFIDSVTTFGCSLAKHRKSNTLEAKDILLHVERTWNMTLPGFSGDEIKTFKKPVANDIHKERLALIKKSLSGAETGTNKTSAGPAAGNVKGHLAKATTNAVGS